MSTLWSSTVGAIARSTASAAARGEGPGTLPEIRTV